ncbi:hypothetical protein SKAU_G00250500 [Synaphobranchus kaupii]|uniref:Uncharacterized protein n=1 Tax=Synaphobranchus kaupii TaxID=118154 RepID=A0A9Q1F2R3_SYNKA|nr:hypothetical protein SKAU_G00250500 [Synaphobranchus kaupii]
MRNVKATGDPEQLIWTESLVKRVSEPAKRVSTRSFRQDGKASSPGLRSIGSTGALRPFRNPGCIPRPAKRTGARACLNTAFHRAGPFRPKGFPVQTAPERPAARAARSSSSRDYKAALSRCINQHKLRTQGGITLLSVNVINHRAGRCSHPGGTHNAAPFITKFYLQ